MITTTTDTQNAWLGGEYTGDLRPMTRVTVQKMNVHLTAYEFPDRKTERIRKGHFASSLFGQQHVPVELPNCKFVKYGRDKDQDVATAELHFYNTAPLPLGSTPDPYKDFDSPGYFTGERGLTGFSSRWSHTATGWSGLLSPDRILRTFRGYGFNAAVPPEDDAHLYPSGVWLIDDVDYTAKPGLIVVTARDAGRLLLEHIHFPPVIPFEEYPIYWAHYVQVDNPDVPDTTTDAGTKWVRPKYQTDSNVPYIGLGFTDGGMAYVSGTGAVQGHHGSDAFDGSTSSYFLSVGNKSTWSSAYEYVQGTIPRSNVGVVKVNAKGGPYKCYISIFADGEWRGSKTIPYGARVVDTNADIDYVKAVSLDFGETKVIRLPKVYQKVTKIRITFSHLWNSGIGVEFPYRAAIQDVQVLTTDRTSVTKLVDGGQHWEGNYEDYTDIIKWLCAWAGFFLPPGSSGANFIKKTDGTKVTYTAAAGDEVIGSVGTVWGDFENTGTYGPNKLDIPTFDKKPLMDGIAYVRDIIGNSFWIDEGGGVVWRSPNVWSIGNYVMPSLGGGYGRTATVIDIDERQTLTDLTSKLSGRNIRERVFVANIAGGAAAMAGGYNPNPSGLRRVSGWTDQNFASDAECTVMADLIALQQAFTYRTNTITIAANPAIQIDDQIRIYERVSEEGYYHYVKSIVEEWDLEAGTWKQTIGTHWLGLSPAGTWVFNSENLAAETQAYLTALGKI